MMQIADFFAGRTIFLTGASGFIGKQLIEKLLRSCPDIARLYVLLRSNKHHTAAARMHHILASPLFAKLKLEQPNLENKIVVVDGNLEKPGLDIDASLKQQLFDEVTIVFHLAATVSFNEPLRLAVSVNITGLRHVLDLCKQMQKLEAFVHTSTAYANCNRHDIAESVYPPPLKPSQILDAVGWMTDDMLKDISEQVVNPWPNTYTFTKAIAEELLLSERGRMPTAIFRPSIVTASVKEPISGWVDNYNGCTGVIAAIGSGFVKAVYGARDKVADLVPVDLTANALIAVAWHTALSKEPDVVRVYNFTSGATNPLTWRNVGLYITRYFRMYPFENSAWIPKGYITENSLWSRYSKHVDIYLKLVGIDFVRRLIGKKPRLLRVHRTVCRMLTLMEFFTRQEWNWAVDNVCRLKDEMSDTDKQAFNFDVRSIDWENYFESYCLGIRQYLLNQKTETLPRSRTALRWLFWVRRSVLLGLFLFCFRLAISRTETARWLWRFTVSTMTALLQRMPRITHS